MKRYIRSAQIDDTFVFDDRDESSLEYEVLCYCAAYYNMLHEYKLSGTLYDGLKDYFGDDLHGNTLKRLARRYNSEYRNHPFKEKDLIPYYAIISQFYDVQ